MKALKISITIISILIVAILGSIFVNIGMPYYMSLTTPTEWIPSILIPIVWSVIYITFAIILSIMIDKDNLDISTYILLILNGVFNVIWCLVFFTLQSTFVGIIIILLNLILAVILILKIYHINPIYSYILSIYPIWISIATTLNLALWILN